MDLRLGCGGAVPIWLPMIGLRRALGGVLLGAACLCLAACAGTKSGPDSVGLSITAPTDGATVGVRSIEIVGSVSPGTARVLIGRRAVKVRHGAFRQPLVLLAPVTHIRIRATASGLLGSSKVVDVHYSATLFGRHGHRSSGGHSPSSSASGASSSSPASPQGAIARGQQAAFRQLRGPDFVAGCSHGNGELVSYCTCVWSRLEGAGFDTRAKFKQVLASWRQSFLTKGVIAYPPVIKKAVVACLPLLQGAG